jgi:hypothetical protein
MKPESDTPRTDLHIKTRAVNIRWPETHVWADADFARTLERELNAAQARIAELEAIEKMLIETRGSLHCQTEFNNRWQFSWCVEGREGREQLNYSVEDTPFKAVGKVTSPTLTDESPAPPER